MTRALALGGRLLPAVDVLGLTATMDRPDIVLVDLEDGDALAQAAAMPTDIPRVLVGRADQQLLLRAAGTPLVVAASAEPATIGPLVAAALPARARGRTRLVVVTAACGGIGRTLLVTGLAHRLAARMSVVVLDATGSGAAGRWLGLDPAPWSELEGLVDELTTEHLAVVAAERDRLRVVGGAPGMPSPALLAAAVRESVGLADVVLVDAPTIFDARTASLVAKADRVLVVATDEPTCVAALNGSLDRERTWLVASRSRAERIGPHDVLRSVPDDPGAVRTAIRGPSPVGGALGRAYDAIAELLVLDVT